MMSRRLPTVFVFVAAFGAWELWARLEPSFLLPPASVVLERAWTVWPTSEFLSSASASLTRLAAGYAIGAGVGITLGVALGASRSARRSLEPLLEFLRAVPAIAILPIAMVILGFGDAMRVSVIAFGVCFPVLVHAVEGGRAVTPEARDTAAILQVSRAERLYRIDLPAALPSIAAGLRVALSIGLVLVVISEFVGSGDGLGRYIVHQQAQYNLPAMYAGILFLGLLGYALNSLFLVAERRVLAWHYGAVGARGA